MVDDILKNNRLIAEFMGGKTINSGYFLPYFGIVNIDSVELGRGKITAYHKSWDWLMPVIKKIRSITSRDRDVFGTDVILYGHKISIKSGAYEPKLHGDRFYNKTFSGAGKDEMETINKAVVDYIKWYNKKNSYGKD